MIEYQCVGGPVDGRTLPLRKSAVMRARWHGDWYYYRLCYVRHRRRIFRYWHYLGTRPDSGLVPRLVPYNLISGSRRPQ